MDGSHLETASVCSSINDAAKARLFNPSAYKDTNGIGKREVVYKLPVG